MEAKNMLKTLNDKVKEVDERFDVRKGRGYSGDIKLSFEDTTRYWINVHGQMDCDQAFKNITLKQALGEPLTEVEQLILKGAQTLYEVYKQFHKFYITLPTEFTPYGKRGISFDMETSSYGIFGLDENDTNKTKFTEEEIATMPEKIQKGIECGFLIKERVDD